MAREDSLPLRWLFCLGFLGVFLFLSASTVAETAMPVGVSDAASVRDTHAPPRYALIYGGDAFCDRRLNYALLSPDERDRKRLFGAVAPLFKESDLAMINLEGMVTTGGYYNRLRGAGYMYRAFPNMVDVLKDAGSDLVTVANNHNGD